MPKTQMYGDELDAYINGMTLEQWLKKKMLR